MKYQKKPLQLLIASRWNSNRIFYRTKQNDTWQPWVEIYHSGNLNPADYVTLSTDQTITGQKTFANKLVVGSLTETPENQLVVYNAGETDTFIQVANGVTGTGEEDGLLIGVEADGDAVHQG